MHQKTNHDTLSIIAGMGAIGFIWGFWGIWTHTFEGDDFFYFAALDQIQAPFDFFSVQAFGRPVVDLMMWILYGVFGQSAAPYHIVLLFLHLCATGVLYVTVSRGRNKTTALLASLFFALNVSHFRAVHWISCMGYPLALCFGLACTRAIALRTYAKSLIFLILGVLSHPGMAFAPLAAFIPSKTRPVAWKPLLVHAGASLFTAFSLTRLYAQTPQAHMFSPSAWELLQKLVWYLGRLITSFACVFPDMQEVYARDIIAGGTLLSICLFLAYRRSFWAAWIILSIVPFATNSDWSYFATGPSRHLYFPSAAISVGAAVMVGQCLKWNRATGLGITAIFIILCAWQLNLSRAHTAYLEGRGHIAHKDLGTGAARLVFASQHAPALIPQDAIMHAGFAMLAKGISLEKLLNAAPPTPWTDMLRGVYAIAQDDAETTRKYLLATAEASKEIPDLALNTAKALNNLATYYYGQKNYDRAEKVAQIALTFAPDYKNAIGVVNASRKHMRQQKQKTPLPLSESK